MSTVAGQDVHEATALPEDPGASLISSTDATETQAVQEVQGKPYSPQEAPLYAKHIQAGRGAEPLNVHEKVELTLRNLYAPYSFASILLLSGYSHLLNGEPNYGTDSGAFGERLGATALRSVSGAVISGAVFAPLLHQDPRYYVEGPSHGVVHRTLYAATRPFVARNDSGHETVNGSLLFGNGVASILSYSYYPHINKNPHDTFATFADSLAGAAIGFFVSEFSQDFLRVLHVKKAS